jgi:putative restriction endonuclease
MESLSYQYHRDVLFSLKRAKHRGVYVNAKPILLITILDALTTGLINVNKIHISDRLIEIYYGNFRKYLPNGKPTPFFKPCFHLISDGFWYFKMNEGYSLPSNFQTPSLKWQKEAIQYAFLSDSLFQIIMKEAEREKLKKELIVHYFHNDNTISI